MSNQTARDRFTIRQNDTDPPIDDTLQDEDGSAEDLSSGVDSVDFHLQAADGTTKVDATGSITDGANGKVEYEWSSGDTDTEGWYKAEWQVNYSDGDTGTFPADGWVTVRVEPELA